MRIIKYSVVILVMAAIAACSGGEGEPALNFSENNGGITLPDGFKAVVVADSVGSARHITINRNGDIYVALDQPHNGKGIAALRDKNGDGVADVKKYFGQYTGTGIDIYQGYLYFGSDTSIVRYKMNEGELLPNLTPQVVVSGFPVQNQHAVKPFTFDQSGNMYVNIGAPSNACQEKMRTPGSPGQDPCPQLESHGGIWQFDATETGQTLQNDGERYATGIRNAVALDWNTHTDQLFVVQHGRDQLHALWPDYYTVEENASQPGEEFFRVHKGDNFGWPYTYYDWKKQQKMIAPEYGGDGETPADKGTYENPIMAFPGHWAPNDLIFYQGSQFPSQYKYGAFIAFHGSWNRAPKPQQGYKVVFVPFDGENPSGDYMAFADNFANKDTLISPNNALYRPMGLAEYPDGSLVIVESRQGKIWRVVYNN